MKSGAHLVQLGNKDRHALRRQLNEVRYNSSTLCRLYGVREDVPYMTALSTLHTPLEKVQDRTASARIFKQLALASTTRERKYAVPKRRQRQLTAAWAQLESVDKHWTKVAQ